MGYLVPMRGGFGGAVSFLGEIVPPSSGALVLD
jgi:hypothetical protein